METTPVLCIYNILLEILTAKIYRYPCITLYEKDSETICKDARTYTNLNLLGATVFTLKHSIYSKLHCNCIVVHFIYKTQWNSFNS